MSTATVTAHNRTQKMAVNTILVGLGQMWTGAIWYRVGGTSGCIKDGGSLERLSGCTGAADLHYRLTQIQTRKHCLDNKLNRIRNMRKMHFEIQYIQICRTRVYSSWASNKRVTTRDLDSVSQTVAQSPKKPVRRYRAELPSLCNTEQSSSEVCR